MTNLLTKAQAWMEEAIEFHAEAAGLFRNARDRAFDAGLLLLSAKEAIDRERPQEWNDFLAAYQDKLSRASAYRYMQVAAAMMEQAIEDNPRLKDRLAIQKAARGLVMQSGLPLLDLMRELGLVKSKEAGGRASDKHKNSTAAQLLFSFDVFDNCLFTLERAGTAVLADIPTDRLQETCNRVASALTMHQLELRGRSISLSPGERAGVRGTGASDDATEKNFTADGENTPLAISETAQPAIQNPPLEPQRVNRKSEIVNPGTL